ncbi:MAG: zinc-ribbon domain-containing protein [Coriobacteriia bacterium]|nr:zinc-ribbon domain-containing protein [Coriobacteriia bacterium]
MLCPKCGLTVEENAETCSNCGEKLTPIATASKETTPPFLQPKKRKMLYIALAAVGLIAIAAVIVFSLTKTKIPGSTASTRSAEEILAQSQFPADNIPVYSPRIAGALYFPGGMLKQNAPAELRITLAGFLLSPDILQKEAYDNNYQSVAQSYYVEVESDSGATQSALFEDVISGDLIMQGFDAGFGEPKTVTVYCYNVSAGPSDSEMKTIWGVPTGVLKAGEDASYQVVEKHAVSASYEIKDMSGGAAQATTKTQSTTKNQETSKTNIYTPEKGSAERTALMNAQRAHDSYSSQYVVDSLYSNGEWAVGWLEFAPGSDGFLAAWHKVSGTWKSLDIKYNGDAGSPDYQSLQAAGMPQELVAKANQ